MAKAITYPEISSKVISGDLIVTEKIHGSNFGIGYVDSSLWIQSRKERINKSCTKFNMQKIIDKLIELVEKMKDVMKCNFLIYGEIFGHMKEIKYYDQDSKRIYGSDTIFFRAFDLYDTDKKMFLKYSDAIDKFEQVGLPYVPILDIKYENIGDLYTKVESYKSAYSEQTVEGFVLKRDEMQSHPRNIFKIKREIFNDKKSEFNKFKVRNYVTFNRYSSAYSKVGDDPEKIKEEMISDSLKDIMSLFEKEITAEVEKFLETISKKNQHIVKNETN